MADTESLRQVAHSRAPLSTWFGIVLLFALFGIIVRAVIDASTRVPVLMFYTSAMAWLILGTLLAGFVSFKLHTPDLFSDISFLTWGRVRPAHMNVMVYGWASMAGMGTAIWLMARLCRTVLRYPLLLLAGACFWNLGVL